MPSPGCIMGSEMSYGDYHQAGRTSAERRRRRGWLTMLLVFALLFGTFGVALAFTQGWVVDRNPMANPTVACVEWKEPPPPRDITVNVYNATNRRGLAVTASQLLAGQKFRVGRIGNDPQRATIEETAQIRYGTRTKAQAQVLALRFPGAALVEQKDRDDGILDVVLGDAYEKVKPVPDPTPPPNAC